MENKHNILRATQYGLGIYAHILRKYYPGETVLHLVGRDCGLCRNPFANGEANLHIWIEKSDHDDPLSDELARHHDNSGTIPDGDAFSFAEQYYHLTGDELLVKLTVELRLQSNDETPDCEQPIPYFPSFPNFSFFHAPITNTKPYRSFTLLDAYRYLIGNKAKKCTEELRAITDKAQAKRFKANYFDYCCFSGSFSYHNDAGLIKHSGLICIDFDHLVNLEELRQKLLLDEYFDTQLLFRSPSGDGLKWVIAVDLGNYTHNDYFQAVAKYILDCYGVQIDMTGSNVSRACFMPYDPNAFINPVILKHYGKESL